MNRHSITQQQAAMAWANLSEAGARCRIAVWCAGSATDLHMDAALTHLEIAAASLGFALTPISTVPPHGGESEQPEPMESRHDLATPDSEIHKPELGGCLSFDAEAPATDDFSKLGR